MKKIGRPVKKNRSVSVHIRLDAGIYELVEKEATDSKFFKANKPNVSRMIREILKKHYFIG